MFGLKKFYVEYSQDCGWAMMSCYGIIESPDLEYAKANWEQLLRSQGFCVVPVANFDGTTYNKVCEVPSHMQTWSSTKLLEVFK